MDQLTRDWQATCHASASRHALRLLAEKEPVVERLHQEGVRDLGDLVAALRRERCELTSEDASAVIRAMLRSEHVHPLVSRALLQALLPGLVSVARRLTWGSGGEWPDGGAFFVDLIATAWEVIAEWAGHDRQYAVLDLLSAVRCRLRRQLLRHRAACERSAGELDPARAGTTPFRRGESDLDELAHAIVDAAQSGIETYDVSVLYAHRVLGYTLSELSEMTGHSRRHLGTRRDRAVHAVTA